MRDMPSRFIEILDPSDGHPRISDSDVRLEDVLADHEAFVTRPRSSTQSSSKATTSSFPTDGPPAEDTRNYTIFYHDV
ncbi:uncharacterized protein BO97DRAFT_422415 [Aspergillus homomorphus CBS 101889]|uniref:Uncharacterized protein n=1 Tax=Aspergillus homomorphus (strain CBS 101889) TaxID=1450537 RepID=A0A395I8P8_ASPHC|nr:hypothetical protein BO97DRAFT_422415 [Aspergillus homomorphus CBS 101889]RAL14514.1 hypothetical protein BO97DRAFT_422415 [Aspergillus homomorphus CBS 101889]